jgi:nicotinate-nucleotide adenylyltransferase
MKTTNAIKSRVGIFGGTFNPIHEGHLAIVDAALREDLSNVIVLPCWLSPHKLTQVNDPMLASGEHRYNMVKEALRGKPNVEVSRIEIDRAEPSFTWKRLEDFRRTYPDQSPVLIIGWDQFAVLDTWTRFKEWSDAVEFLVFRRPSAMQGEMDPGSTKELNYRIVEAVIPSFSSTEIRQALREGRTNIPGVPPGVRDYIHQNLLFRADNHRPEPSTLPS